MREQLTLFTSSGRSLHQPRPVARLDPPSNGTDTSHEAARRVRPVVNRQRRRVFEFFLTRDATGATDFEVQQALDMKGDTERPRRGELQKLGLITDSGERRASETGRPLKVYVATGKPWPDDSRGASS